MDWLTKIWNSIKTTLGVSSPSSSSTPSPANARGSITAGVAATGIGSTPSQTAKIGW